jgi:TonB family protein
MLKGMNDMRRCLALLLLCIAAGTLSAVAQEPENALKQYQGKILVLRHPLESSSHRYDADGHVLNHEAEGAWTVYGGVLIDKFAVRPDQLRIQGRRILFFFRDGQLKAVVMTKNGLRNPPFSPAMKLELGLAHSLNSAEEVRTVMGRVFVMNATQLLDILPDFWRGYLRDQLIYDAEAQPEKFSWQGDVKIAKFEPLAMKQAKSPEQLVANPEQIKPELITKDDDDSSTVFKVGLGVSAPKPKSTPEPEFTEIARYEKYPGTVVVNVVVGTDGNVHRIRLVRALGLGLDESAETRLKTWRFEPALRDGKPVAVEMNIEVSFNLY